MLNYSDTMQTCYETTQGVGSGMPQHEMLIVSKSELSCQPFDKPFK